MRSTIRSLRSSLALAIGWIAVSGCSVPPPPMGLRIADGEVGVSESSLSAAERRARAGQIRDAACGAGMTQGWMLAGIADAETNMSHCWSELTWACMGPSSADCGGGPVVAGAGDGPCSLRQGGLGMFQFDAGTYDDTLAREGTRILSIAGNTEAAVDFVVSMVQRSVYTPSLPTRESAIDWMNGVRVGNDRWDTWIRTVTHYYNGCTPAASCFPTRYAHYRDNTSGVYDEMGADFWTCCRESPEVCNGADDDCDGTADEDEVCEIALLHDQPSAYAPPRTTDVNADGRTDVCARASSGLLCYPSGTDGWEPAWAPVPWSDDAGWSDAVHYSTLRMGDVNGDGRADACGRSSTDFLCALSSGTGFGDATAWRADLSDANGWSLPQYYTTIRLADADGDGRDDLCARDSLGFGCWLSDGTRFDRRVEGPRWSDAAGFASARYYGTLRMGDLDGDRRADVCIRASDGVDCVLSDGAGFTRSIGGPDWSDAEWSAMASWSTLRLADVNGDGLADLCGRSSSDLRCELSTGTGFGAEIVVAALSDASGWADPSNYATLRTGDVDGDGAEDLCLRSDERVLCWAWDRSAFAELEGPGWSDARGWSDRRYFETIRVADFDGDGRADVCARAALGWSCSRSTADGFTENRTSMELADAAGWGEPRYWSTIMSGGGSCALRTEVCNGRDDDCDGAVDEDLSCIVGDGGVVGPGDGGPRGGVGGGCACAAGAPRRAPSTLLWLALAALAWRRRRHSRGKSRNRA